MLVQRDARQLVGVVQVDLRALCQLHGACRRLEHLLLVSALVCLHERLLPYLRDGFRVADRRVPCEPPGLHVLELRFRVLDDLINVRLLRDFCRVLLSGSIECGEHLLPRDVLPAVEQLPQLHALGICRVVLSKTNRCVCPSSRRLVDLLLPHLCRRLRRREEQRRDRRDHARLNEVLHPRRVVLIRHPCDHRERRVEIVLQILLDQLR